MGNATLPNRFAVVGTIMNVENRYRVMKENNLRFKRIHLWENLLSMILWHSKEIRNTNPPI
jgi:hypothetical protein